MSQAGITNAANSNPQIPTSFVTDLGTATPSANILNVLGGTGITTSALGNVVTITNTSSIPTGASGTVLQGQGIGVNPAFSTATYPSTAGTSGKVLQSNGTNFVESTPTYPSASGDSGKVLISDGTNNVYSTPTYPNSAATTGQILRADGTNWVGTTATYPNTAGTTGNLLTSDGTNWTSANPTIYSATLNLTNAQIKSLFTTPITIVAAKGAGTVITVISVMVKFIYGGTNAFTGGGNLNIRYTNTTGQSINASIMTSALILGTASVYSQSLNTAISGAAIANMENRLVCIHNATAAFAGNAANNNFINVKILYYITQI